MVCGGVPGIMDHLRDMCVRPDAKTITLLLDCLPADCTSEAELIAEADKMGVALDVDFFNILIKRRALRGDKEQARVSRRPTLRSSMPRLEKMRE